MNNQSNKITFPSHITTNSILSLIRAMSFVFKLKDRMAANYVVDISNVKEINMLGVLLLCKFLEFSISHRCFSEPQLGINDIVKEAIAKYGCLSLVQSFMNPKGDNRKELESLKTKIQDNFIIAPKALLRNDSYSKESLNTDYLPAINDYYSNTIKASDMILQVFSEILLNFWEHAVDDTRSIIIAHGTKTNIEIACIDTGNGIKTTLSENVKLKKSEKSDILLSKAVQKGVTSKTNTDHMGFGLWIVDEIVSKVGGRLRLISESSAYINDSGKKTTTGCDYWGGTIIYVYLPLENPVTIADIEKGKQLNAKICWI